jgi:hypothetical protein
MGRLYRDRAFRYASIQDGQEWFVLQSFTVQAAFVAWLAAPSDASLAGRDDPDPFLRGNQRITRARLLSVAGTK